MLKVQVTSAQGATTLHTGPEYRGLLLRQLAKLKRESAPLPLTEAEARQKPLTDLVAADTAWAASHHPGYLAEVVSA